MALNFIRNDWKWIDKIFPHPSILLIQIWFQDCIGLFPEFVLGYYPEFVLGYYPEFVLGYYPVFLSDTTSLSDIISYFAFEQSEPHNT
jgi:hypothetical protein